MLARPEDAQIRPRSRQFFPSPLVAFLSRHKGQHAAIASIIILCVAVGDAALYGSDFHVYYLAGHRALTGAPLYQLADGPLPFKYHPTWALLFGAVSVLPERLADVV